MKAREYIIRRQEEWARNQGLPLIGSKVEKGRETFVRPDAEVENSRNFFEPMTKEVVKQIRSGDGGEMTRKGNGEWPARIEALQSSSAIAVNVFQYWARIGKIDEIAAACGFCSLKNGRRVCGSIRFEEKFQILENSRNHPNIDVVLPTDDDAQYRFFAIESKFTEPFSSYNEKPKQQPEGEQSKNSKGLKKKYLEQDDLWKGMPELKNLARVISPEDRKFRRLHAAQLIKHILGLKKRCGGSKSEFRLLYLWYDAPGDEAVTHREEIETFGKIAKADRIKFHSLTYQQLISELAKKFRVEHPEYIKYITERYL